MKSVLAKLNTLRRWVDRDDGMEDDSEQISKNHPSQEFLLLVASEIERVLEAETFTPPGGSAIIPHEFIVFMSLDDDRAWRGPKRRAFEEGLAHTLRLKTIELFRGKQLATHSFAIELRVDGTLQRGQFRVKACWDAITVRTRVTARGRNAGKSSGPPAAEIRIASDEIRIASDEITLVGTRLSVVLYAIEVWHAGEKQMIVPVTKSEFAIGRGSSTVPVDLQLRGDAEMSRLHVVLSRDAEGRILLTLKGRKPVFVNDREALREERTVVEPGSAIKICSYELRMQKTGWCSVSID